MNKEEMKYVRVGKQGSGKTNWLKYYENEHSNWADLTFNNYIKQLIILQNKPIGEQFARETNFSKHYRNKYNSGVDQLFDDYREYVILQAKNEKTTIIDYIKYLSISDNFIDFKKQA